MDLVDVLGIMIRKGECQSLVVQRYGWDQDLVFIMEMMFAVSYSWELRIDDRECRYICHQYQWYQHTTKVHHWDHIERRRGQLASFVSHRGLLCTLRHHFARAVPDDGSFGFVSEALFHESGLTGEEQTHHDCADGRGYRY